MCPEFRKEHLRLGGWSGQDNSGIDDVRVGEFMG